MSFKVICFTFEAAPSFSNQEALNIWLYLVRNAFIHFIVSAISGYVKFYPRKVDLKNY